MSERRSVMMPPEMTNGSRSGSVSSNSSARAMRIGQKIQEMQLAAATVQQAGGFALEHHGNQPVARIEDQCMQRALGPRALGRGVLVERELEEGVQLGGRTAAQRVVYDHAARVNVSCPGEFRDPPACARGQPSQNPQIAITQFGSTICDTRR